jgi:hypothetical protein
MKTNKPPSKPNIEVQYLKIIKIKKIHRMILISNSWSFCGTLTIIFKKNIQKYAKTIPKAISKTMMKYYHVLCIKSLGDSEDRPLTNVAGAIALQLFIDKGYMKIDEVPDPYG